MLHKVELPELTKTCLNQVIEIQKLFLRFAAQVDPAQIDTEFTKDSCDAFFQAISGFEPRATKLASWLFDRKSDRSKILRNFAEHSPEQEKIALVQLVV